MTRMPNKSLEIRRENAGAFPASQLHRSAIDELAYLKSNLTKMRLSHIDCKRFYKDLMI